MTADPTSVGRERDASEKIRSRNLWSVWTEMDGTLL